MEDLPRSRPKNPNPAGEDPPLVGSGSIPPQVLDCTNEGSGVDSENTADGLRHKLVGQKNLHKFSQVLGFDRGLRLPSDLSRDAVSLEGPSVATWLKCDGLCGVP